MFSQEGKKYLSKLPDSPGVYFFISDLGEILYIGKATSLRYRVKSYFSRDLFETRGPKIVKMLSEAKKIDFQKTDSVLEALLLENYLIKKHQPIYNTLEKDDKSYNYVVITEEDYPRVLMVRGREILITNLNFEKLGYKIKESFGPFPSGALVKESLKIIRKIFPYRDKCLPRENNNKSKPCFNRQIRLCPGVCTGEISKTDYNKIIRNITHFFKGEKKDILKDLNKEMKNFSKQKEFEKAGEVKRKIFSLNHIHDISILKSDFSNLPTYDTRIEFRIESYDIAHISGSHVVGVMVVVEDGEINKSEYRKFKIKNDPNGNDLKSLKEILVRRLDHKEWKKPNLIVVDGGENQRKVFRDVLRKSKDWKDIPIVSVVKDISHKAREILGESAVEQQLSEKFKNEILLSNLEAHRFAINYHKKIRDKINDK